jgi:amino acid transporter
MTESNKSTFQKDAMELSLFGYKQQLRRSMGRFSSFAISFSLISVITGIFANFTFGLQQVGGILVWSWLLVGIGQFLVALVMADLSTRFPISGYGYQWTSRLTNPHIGYFVGWLLLLQFITGFPGVCQAMANTLYGLIGGSGTSWTVTWITVIIISLITIIHLVGIKWVSFVNDSGVFAEIIGVLIIIFVLGGAWLLAGKLDFSNLLNATNQVTQEAAGFSAFALSLLVGAWCLTGFEAAADLAEETHQPRKVVPRSVISSQVTATLAGFLMLSVFILSMDDIQAYLNNENPIVTVIESKIGVTLSSIIGIIVLLSIFACGVASMATATRLMYSMARDNILPFSGALKTVNERYKTPQVATIVVWTLACLFVISIRHLELITSISAVAAYLGYAGIMYATLRSKSSAEKMEGFSLGKFRRPVQWMSLCWTLLVVAALTLPENKVTGMDETHLPAKSTFFALLVGVLLYILLIRKKIRSGNAGPPKNKNTP